MGRDKPKDILSDGALAGGAGRDAPSPIERLVGKIVEALPLLDDKAVADALAEIETHPRASLHFLFQHIGSDNADTRAVVGWLLARCKGPDVVDNLNAVVFDADMSARTKVLANEILASLGQPVDPDVFAMGVPDAEAVRKELPSYAPALLAEGRTEEAAAHAAGMEPADRYLTMHDAAARFKENAVGFLDILARQNPENAAAAADAIGAIPLAAGVPLLTDLLNSADRSLQKLIKRILFEMRKAGVEIPREQTPDIGVAKTEKTDEEPPLYRALISEANPAGIVVVIVARRRPNGRLKVFSTVVSLWKRGIDRAAFRVDMSRSSFDRFVASQSSERMKLRQTSLEECRRMIARGLRVTKELGTPVPLDFGLGKALLGDVDSEAARIGNPFRCSGCGAELDEAAVAKIRDLAPYDNMMPETRCAACRVVSET